MRKRRPEPQGLKARHIKTYYELIGKESRKPTRAESPIPTFTAENHYNIQPDRNVNNQASPNINSILI